MDLVPASQDLSSAELELVVADMRDLRLKYALDPMQEQYDTKSGLTTPFIRKDNLPEGDRILETWSKKRISNLT
jgi:hypothetical protein